MDRFHGATLFISARSPFARRVRLALREHGLSVREEVVDVFKPTPALLEANPWARVPALRLRGGETLVESEKILAFVYREAGEGSPLRARDADELLLIERWSGWAVAFCEKTVEFYLDSLRPDPDPEVRRELERGSERVLGELEAWLAGRESIASGRLTQADLDLGSALAYFSLRYSPSWRATHPRAAAYADRLEQRPSFQATRPPAA
jgi:glutathione S-transferase